jgi:hypothetical protein
MLLHKSDDPETNEDTQIPDHTESEFPQTLKCVIHIIHYLEANKMERALLAASAVHVADAYSAQAADLAVPPYTRTQAPPIALANGQWRAARQPGRRHGPGSPK